MLAKSIILWSVAAIAQARTVPQKGSNNNAAGTAAVENIVYDGRVKANAAKADFDSSTGPFGKDNVKGQSACFSIHISQFQCLPETDLTFSQLVAFPAVDRSIFDAKVGAKAIEVQVKLVFLIQVLKFHTD
jgi:hypothetical protein